LSEPRLVGRVAIVTGGARGIGAAVVSRLAADGASVVVADIDEAAAESVVASVVADGREAVAIRVDLTDEESVAALVSATLDRYGAVDILDNNAALTEGDVLARDGEVTEMDLAVWNRMFAVNLTSQLLTSKHVIPHMVRAGRGAVVNMSSGAAFAGDVTRSAYSASKAAIESLTRSIATQYGRAGVRANTIVPGLIVTESLQAVIPPAMLAGYARSMLTPHVGRPRDIADLVAFLVSDESRYITGQTIRIDGGMSTHSASLPEQSPEVLDLS
jgi:NAD(P)-dependent dehydrogenase (short-subunit alcohol dehydrogenase family)